MKESRERIARPKPNSETKVSIHTSLAPVLSNQDLSASGSWHIAYRNYLSEPTTSWGPTAFDDHLGDDY